MHLVHLFATYLVPWILPFVLGILSVLYKLEQCQGLLFLGATISVVNFFGSSHFFAYIAICYARLQSSHPYFHRSGIKLVLLRVPFLYWLVNFVVFNCRFIFVCDYRLLAFMVNQLEEMMYLLDF